MASFSFITPLSHPVLILGVTAYFFPMWSFILVSDCPFLPPVLMITK